jgi:hypothetical protein
LNGGSDDSSEEIQTTKKSSTKNNKKNKVEGESDIKTINNSIKSTKSAKSTQVDDDGFQTVNALKPKKIKDKKQDSEEEFTAAVVTTKSTKSTKSTKEKKKKNVEKVEKSDNEEIVVVKEKKTKKTKKIEKDEQSEEDVEEAVKAEEAEEAEESVESVESAEETVDIKDKKSDNKETFKTNIVSNENNQSIFSDDKPENNTDVKPENNTDVKPENNTDTSQNYSSPGNNDGWGLQQKKRKHDRFDKSTNEMVIDADKIQYYNPANKLNGDDMKLNTKWVVWTHENDNQDWSLSSYTNIYEYDSIGSMWRFLWNLENLNKNDRQYYIMRQGITPIWEDNNNKKGAICSILIDNMNRNAKHSRGDLGVDTFIAFCILVNNESFVKNNEEINGLCYSIKSRSVLIKLWIKDYESNRNFTDKLPISLLKSIETIIIKFEEKSNHTYNNYIKSNRPKVSVQIREIKPAY